MEHRTTRRRITPALPLSISAVPSEAILLLTGSCRFNAQCDKCSGWASGLSRESGMTNKCSGRNGPVLAKSFLLCCLNEFIVQRKRITAQPGCSRR